MRDAFTQVFDSILGPSPKALDPIGLLRQRLRPEGLQERLLQEVSKQRGHQLIHANTVLAIPAACRLKHRWPIHQNSGTCA
ncbi:MAG: hypothetical protein IPO87_10795 [Flavobacteriales bacterium]|nr:hypothetical protein [Flavobacteriales bacterium]